MRKHLLFLLLIFFSLSIFAQDQEQMVQNILKEVEQHSDTHLKLNAHELFDLIGPRLVGTPKMKEANDWAVEKYKSYGIEAENQKWGEWRAWERGITHIDMISPWVKTLAGTQLAWNPGTSKKGVKADVVILPDNIKDSISFQKWLPNVKGKFVMIDIKQPTGRPDYDWEKWATPESFEKMKKERKALNKAWAENLRKTGLVKSPGLRGMTKMIEALEEAGAAGILKNYWSNGFGTDKIFWAETKNIPTVDIELEDYTMLYRMVENGTTPKLHIVAQSKDLGTAPTFNTVAKIEGSEKPDEIVLLSAHFDSWDGGTGATDNGTGTLLMMEVMRILKKYYPNPKRTIMVGHWGSEEQGLNGSAAFVEDHPEIVDNLQVVFNQDNGTGRVKNISGSGFLNSYNYISRWLEAVPDTVSSIDTHFPGNPARGGTDHASFVRAGAPAFNLSSLSWSYWNYTWHTNRDTYDKIVWDDLKNNVILTTVLAYMASEDPETTSREKIVLPIDKETGEPQEWPDKIKPERNGKGGS
ncbi:MAG TPA: M20/M25/M40 family metallo-hydrolase [Flavobacteriaceae bacterium]|nr:M20/M25/M40 family metallo-hydrolase [Flavobacteriaceae bacterium]